MPIDQQLEQELSAWRSAGLTAKFWWRDDDAITDTPQLRCLCDLARQTGIVPGIAVVPEHADQALLTLLSSIECCVWQHGWGHYTFGDAGEFGEERALELMLRDALAGQAALDRLFGPGGWQRVFVPPFHLLSMCFKALIPSLGYRGVSAGVPLTPCIGGVAEVNAEIDVMNWPEQRMLGDAEISNMVVQQLAARRLGKAPIDQPVGLLTHHLVFGENEWRYTAELFQFLLAHPVVRFERADRLFRPVDRMAAVTAPIGPADITVVVTSCGRQDLLERTLDSFLRYNTYPVRDFVVIEDGAGDANRRLEESYRPCNIKWLATGKRIGQIPAIDEAYTHVRTEYIFHCEDDWEFTAPGFIERSLAVLTANPNVLQVWIRALNDTNEHPVMKPTLFAGRVPYRLLQPGYHTEEWGTWHGFSFNPGLRRRRDYESIGSFGSFDPGRTKRAFEVEREASAVYLKLGFLAAILADNHGEGYAKHIGWGRRV